MQKLHLSIPNTPWRKFKQGILLLAMLGLVTPVWAGVVQILQITGEACWFKVKRGGQEYGDVCEEGRLRLPPGVIPFAQLRGGFAPYALLQSGDEVCVIKDDKDPHGGKLSNGKEYSITLSLSADSSPKELTYHDYNCENNPPLYFPIPTSGILEGFLGGPLVSILQSLWEHDTRLRQAITQGDGGTKKSLSIPLLSGSTAQLVKKDKVYLGWYGGTPPYKVQVLALGEKPEKLTVLDNCINQTEIELKGVALIPTRRYRVQVFDSTSCDSTPPGNNDAGNSNQSVIGEFTVVDTKSLPDSVVQNEKVGTPRSELPPYSQKILPVLLMLKNNEETWSFEAYQLAKSVLDECVADKNVADKNTPPAPCYPAYLLMRGLKEGWK
ncbi:MAG: hypothetical protein BWK78_04660 [Thiotrichaceae bacterium IS1]|nr:MAG: hypothetical protein BWK78_04660 [Thiotrichaceae bacterium IS1]